MDQAIIPLYSESAGYREWDVTIDITDYCIVCDGGTWTLLYYDPEDHTWYEAPDDVGTFLCTNQLSLGA